MFDTPLSTEEQRVLGCLVEKQMSTPDYYPLTLNALVNACNQSSNRDPVMTLGEEGVLEALDLLRDRQLLWVLDSPGSRARKYEHRAAETLGLSVQEAAILAELLLRGPQTPGELRGRCTRMYGFADLQEVEAALGVMQEAEHPLVVGLPRQPGTKETRYAHALGSLPEARAQAPAPTPSRTSQLEAEVAVLREELGQLREAFEAFKRQFE
ncbi:MAG TPA: YceH family protein [Holophaga sp.]|nr:YceH family protein [Holophaga sp.]